MTGFKKFLFRGNLIELAVAVVIGAAFTNVVNALVRGFIGPLIALVGGEPNYDNLKFTIAGTEFPYGVFLTAAISFLITAAVVYWLVVLPATKLVERMSRAEEAVEHPCPHCLSDIPKLATRCRYCTAEVEPVA
ncbi:large conductance mechanosensitive channel protein MscL [Actinomadura kijaniata]|uniref:Large conductance mechanosensitive channel n=1 Tax=Actinomadura namibiensis TaxID=182080 RepID=A0A7W3LYM4_ACTNM|nr:large conductance mechanosensitive channel protein MscL [Actinomadura namibiensis]MBA8956610.1 large conductance mechanosensitive channel [Actinomadura namibiensis]